MRVPRRTSEGKAIHVLPSPGMLLCSVPCRAKPGGLPEAGNGPHREEHCRMATSSHCCFGFSHRFLTSGISSLASHCHLPDLSRSLTLCYHRMLNNLPNGSPALLLWSSGPRIPASTALCPRRHPTWPAASCHSHVSAISLPQILPLSRSL